MKGITAKRERSDEKGASIMHEDGLKAKYRAHAPDPKGKPLRGKK